MRKHSILLASAILTAGFPWLHASRGESAPREEMRGLWVARWSLESPQAVRHVVLQAKKHNFNALFVQARGRGDAWFISDLEPRGESLSGQPADFDPLALVVREAHAQGLQVHAWLNT